MKIVLLNGDSGSAQRQIIHENSIRLLDYVPKLFTKKISLNQFEFRVGLPKEPHPPHKMLLHRLQNDTLTLDNEPSPLTIISLFLNSS